MQNILILSHAGIVDVNRAMFEQMAKIVDAEMVLMVPEVWKGDLIKDLRFNINDSNHSELRVLALPIYFSGNGSLFFYKTCPRKALAGWTPDIVFAYEEPWSLNCFQIFRNFSQAKRCFFTNQNLKKKLPPPFNFLQRWIFRNSLKAFAVGTEAEEVLRWKKYQGEVCKLPFSYDPKIFYEHSNEEKLRKRREMGIDENVTVVAYVGRLAEELDVRQKMDLLESKIEGLRNTLEQREELITKLNQEIQENVDPLKREAVGGVIDKQKEGLKQNLDRMEEKLELIEKQKVELQALANKAIEDRDEAIIRNKTINTKLKQLENSSNARITELENQLERTNRQKEKISKRMEELKKRESGE